MLSKNLSTQTLFLCNSKWRYGLDINVGNLIKQSHFLHDYTLQILEKPKYDSPLNDFNFQNYWIHSKNNPVHSVYLLEVEDFG